MYVIIAGINSLSERLVSRLEGRHDVVIIDPDKDMCERFYSSTGATVINKSPSDISALEDAGITKADVIIGAQRKDNENMVVCSLAKKYGVSKVLTRVEDDDYFDAFEMIGADPVNHNDILISEFLSAVEHPHLVKLADIGDDREISKASVGQGSKLLDENPENLTDLKGFPGGFRLLAVIRDGKDRSPEEVEALRVDDKLVIVGPETHKEKLNSFFRNQ